MSYWQNVQGAVNEDWARFYAERAPQITGMGAPAPAAQPTMQTGGSLTFNERSGTYDAPGAGAAPDVGTYVRSLDWSNSAQATQQLAAAKAQYGWTDDQIGAPLGYTGAQIAQHFAGGGGGTTGTVPTSVMQSMHAAPAANSGSAYDSKGVYIEGGMAYLPIWQQGGTGQGQTWTPDGTREMTHILRSKPNATVGDKGEVIDARTGQVLQEFIVPAPDFWDVWGPRIAGAIIGGAAVGAAGAALGGAPTAAGMIAEGGFPAMTGGTAAGGAAGSAAGFVGEAAWMPTPGATPLDFGIPGLEAAVSAGNGQLAGEILSKAALDGTNIFGANSIPGALDISALSAATTPAAARLALEGITSNLGYTAPAIPPGAPPGSAPPTEAPFNGPPTAPGYGAPPIAPPGGASFGGLTIPGLASLAGPVASVVSGLAGAKASSDAAEIQANAGKDALGLQRYIYEDSKALNKPFYDTGVKGITRMSELLGLSGDKKTPGYGELMRPFDLVADYEQDPGYMFRVAEGNKALDRSAAAKGGYNSGRAAKDLMRFGQGEASQEFGNSWNRWKSNQTDKFNRMASVAGIGQTAASQVGNAGQNYGQQAGQTMQGIGNAQAAGRVGSANAWTNAIGQGVSMYNQGELMNRLLTLEEKRVK